jgi:hypothetical protein
LQEVPNNPFKREREREKERKREREKERKREREKERKIGKEKKKEKKGEERRRTLCAAVPSVGAASSRRVTPSHTLPQDVLLLQELM